MKRIKVVKNDDGTIKDISITEMPTLGSRPKRKRWVDFSVLKTKIVTWYHNVPAGTISATAVGVMVSIALLLGLLVTAQVVRQGFFLNDPDPVATTIRQNERLIQAKQNECYTDPRCGHIDMITGQWYWKPGLEPKDDLH